MRVRGVAAALGDYAWLDAVHYWDVSSARCSGEVSEPTREVSEIDEGAVDEFFACADVDDGRVVGTIATFGRGLDGRKIPQVSVRVADEECVSYDAFLFEAESVFDEEFTRKRCEGETVSDK